MQNTFVLSKKTFMSVIPLNLLWNLNKFSVKFVKLKHTF